MNAFTAIGSLDEIRIESAVDTAKVAPLFQKAGHITARIESARKSFTTRRVDFSEAKGLIKQAAPRSGDLVLARVDTIGQHTKLEAPSGRRGKLYPGDEIIVAYGARYAPDQFEAEVPSDLSPCELVAGGGVASRVLSRNSKISRATRITPIGLLADDLGQVLNLSRYALATTLRSGARPTVIAVAGSSMNAGKTTTASGLIHGLTRAGLRVAGIKVTGTGSGGDLWSMADAGAEWTFDFTDMGHASTAGLELPAVERIVTGLFRHVASLGSDIVVMEVADGLFQRETAQLLQSPLFRRQIDGILFAAGDALGAAGGIQWLKAHELPVLALSGQFTASPLAIREAEANTDIAVASLDDLNDPHFATRLCFGAGQEKVARLA